MSEATPHDCDTCGTPAPVAQYLRVRETARRLGLHENTIRNMLADGRLEDVRVPGTRGARIDARQVETLEAARATFDAGTAGEEGR